MGGVLALLGMASKHVEAFSKQLSPGETIVTAAEGVPVTLNRGGGLGKGACIVTNTRVVLFRKGFFGGEDQQALPLSAVASVSHSRFLGWSVLQFKTASEVIEFRTGDKSAVEALRAAVDAGRNVAK